MRVTAAVLYDTKKPVVVEDVELLEPGPHEVQVRWVANGVCHSDLHVITGDSPHPLPVVLGHEAAGVVEKVGPGVETDRKSTRLNSSHLVISYAVFCLKKKKKKQKRDNIVSNIGASKRA